MPKLKCFSWLLFLTEVVLKLRVFVIVFFRSLLGIISCEEDCLWNYFGFNFHAFICTNKNHVCVSCVEKTLNCNLLIVTANISFFCESHDKCHKTCLIHCIFIFVHGFIWPLTDLIEGLKGFENEADSFNISNLPRAHNEQIARCGNFNFVFKNTILFGKYLLWEFACEEVDNFYSFNVSARKWKFLMRKEVNKGGIRFVGDHIILART